MESFPTKRFPLRAGLVRRQEWDLTEDGDLAAAADRLAGTFTTLAALYIDSPTPLLVESLRKGPILELTGLGDSGGEVSGGMEGMGAYIETTRSAPSQEVALELAKDWNRLFRGVAQGAGPPPPVESLYADTEDDMHLLRVLARIYSDHGLEIDGGFLDRPDCIGVEFAFLAELFRRVTEAIQSGAYDRAAESFAAASHFFAFHPGKWTSTFCGEAIRHAGTGFYRGLLQLTRGVVLALAMAWPYTMEPEET